MPGRPVRKPWRLLSSEDIVDDKWMRFRADTCEGPDGALIAPYYVIEERDWAQCFALNSVGELLLVTQYRHAARQFCDELPGGIVDEGETPLQAAQRELREETGYTATTWVSAGQFFANPARQTNRVHIFIATDIAETATPELDSGEYVEASFATTNDVIERIRDGRFSQGLHIASFYMCLRQLAD